MPGKDSIGWDDFGMVKAIADGRRLQAAAEQLGLNHSTVFRRLSLLGEVWQPSPGQSTGGATVHRPHIRMIVPA